MIVRLVLAAILTEALVEVFHRAVWFRSTREHLEDRFKDWTVAGGFIRCKYCQSWWVAWAVCLAMALAGGAWSWHWLWMGPVASRGANLLHHIVEAIWAGHPYKWAGMRK